MRKAPPDLFPLHATFDGYRAVLREQLPYLLTSLASVSARCCLPC